MCRLLAVVASEPTEFRLVLHEAPRSLRALSRERPDGWGIAVFDVEASRRAGAESDPEAGWSVRRGMTCAAEDAEFERLAVGSRGEIIVSHVRKKTVGPTALANTHPFASDGFVFAHNGTISDLEMMRSRASPARLGAVRGDTDSELFFAYLMSELDRAGLDARADAADIDRVVLRVVEAGWSRPAFGAFNFLLSNGASVWAHRAGRSLFLLERGPHDAVIPRRPSEDGTVLETRWSQRRRAVFVASERLTNEPWRELDDRSLLRIDRAPRPDWKRLA